MAVIRGSIDKQYLELYKGFGEKEVGPGTSPDNIYASQSYARRKVQTLYMGALADVIYAGMEHDTKPLIIPFRLENQYNTILAFNLNYLPIKLRENVLNFILESNKNRIRSQQQIIVDYNSVKRAVPQVEGCIRRYKLQLINVRQTHPIVEWGKVVRNSGSQYSNIYRRITS